MAIDWPINSFPILVSSGANRQVSQRKRAAQFGGGYRQTAPESINPYSATASFSVPVFEDVPGRTLNDLEGLIARSAETYRIQFPGQDPKIWEIDSYNVIASNDTTQEVSIQVRLYNDPSVFDSSESMPGAYRLIYTPSWSSVLSSPPPTYEVLQDGPNSGFGSISSSNQFLQADLGSSKNIGFVAVEAGILSGFGATAAVLNDAQVQISNNAISWAHVATISGLTDSNGKKFFSFPQSAYARYVRLLKFTNGIALTRFEVWGIV